VLLSSEDDQMTSYAACHSLTLHRLTEGRNEIRHNSVNEHIFSLIFSGNKEIEMQDILIQFIWLSDFRKDFRALFKVFLTM